jgi:hypothetical protein
LAPNKQCEDLGDDGGGSATYEQVLDVIDEYGSADPVTRLREYAEATEVAVRAYTEGVGNKVENAAKEVANSAATTATKIYKSTQFRFGLVLVSGKLPFNSDAHHMFPQKYIDSFLDAGIDINDPTFGAWWKRPEHQQEAYKYNEQWRVFLGGKRTPSEVLDFGRQLSQVYGLEIYF